MKRVPSLIADGPDSKKQRAALVDPLVARREIVQVYNAYDVLLAGCEDPRPMLDVLVRAGQGAQQLIACLSCVHGCDRCG